jgi:hypothetical protein
MLEELVINVMRNLVTFLTFINCAKCKTFLLDGWPDIRYNAFRFARMYANC